MKQIYSSFKVAHHLDKVESLRKGNFILPTQVQIDLTNSCNHKCPYCFYRCARNEELNSDFYELDILPYNRIASLIDEFKEIGIPAVQYTGGGEPFTHPHIHEILDKTIKTGIEYSLVSNGVLLNEDYVDLYKKATWIRISIDGATPKTFAKSQGCDVSDYDKVINNIKMLVANCKDTEIGLSFVVNPINYKEILMFKELAESLGVQNIRYSVSYTPQGIKIFKENWAGILEDARQLTKNSDGKVKVFDFILSHLEDLDLKNKGYNKCGYQQFTAVIGANSLLYPCCTLKYSSLINFGSIYNNSFKDLWFGEKRMRWLNSNYMERVCNNKPCWMDSKNRFIDYLVSNNPPHVNYI